MLNDLRYALRTLALRPGFTAVAILTLALGIGANTAIFSAINGVLLRPLPYTESDRLVQIMSTGFQGVRFGVSFPDLNDLRALAQDFTGVAAVTSQRYNLTGAGDPREVQMAAVTADLFEVLQVRPEIGHAFTAADERTPLALLSHGLWVASFGSNHDILGKSISLDGRSFTVIGVMPAGFRFPNADVQLWTPIGEFLRQNPEAETNRGMHFLQAVARLARGASVERVIGDVGVLAARLNASDTTGPGGRGQLMSLAVPGSAGPPSRPGAASPGARRSILDTGFDVSLLRDAGIGDVRRPLFILLGAVGLVLLIACANAANLLLARAAVRRREMAVRRALGAGRGRLVRQVLTESTVLALAAGVVGVVLSVWGLDALVAIWPDALPRATEIGLDSRVLTFSLGLALLTGVAFGLLPAWRASAPGIEEALRQDAPGATGGRWRLQSALVVGEVMLALVLLVGAGLLVRSFIRLSNVNPGFDTRDVLAARIRLTPARFPSGAQQQLFFVDMLATLESNPGVQSASLASTLPMSGQFFMRLFDPRTVRPDYPEPMMVLRSFSVSPDYFTMFRIPIRRGRGFTVEDRAGAPSVAIINRTTVDQLWPGQDPIGKQLTIRGGPGQPAGPVAIVGVIDNLRSASLDAAPQPEIYRPAAQMAVLPEMWVALRASNGRPLQLAAAIRDAVHRADPEQSIGEIVSLEQLIGRQTAARRFNTTLLTIFALIAVGLALVGIYGVTAYAVTQRTRELGIRMALGARGADVVTLLMKESLRRVAAGVALGLVAAWGVTRALAAMLFEVAPRDAPTFAATAVLLIVVALVATWVPARRATKVDPMVALRYE
ncbi:MAG TPA: ABC transporter permease [Gemmatimonadales bacterium]|nr:ABC transporter permease [Gemmatimonadales bacterium]